LYLQQDPSVKTKWLPEEDITIGQAPKAEVDSKPTHQAATLRNAANVDDINEEKAGVEPRNESEAHEDFPSESIEETHLTELPRIDLDGVEKKNPLHKQVVGKGKAMIQKLLTESNSANSRPRYGTERLHISSVNGREKTHSFDDFIDRETDQMSPFRATRENVFCTSSQESVIDSANASFDDDIAGAFSHASETVCRPDVKREGSPVDSQYSKRPALDQQVKQEPLSTSPEIRDAQPTANASKARLPVKTKETGGADVEGRAVRYANDRWSSDEDENRFSSSAGFVSTNDEDKEAMLERKEEHETVKHQSPSSNRTCKREESEEEFSKTRGDDPSFGGSARVLEPVSEKTEELGDEDRASEHSAPPRSEPACFAERSRERDEIAKDRTAENFKERQPPKKFNIGGFGSPDAAGFGTSSFVSRIVGDYDLEEKWMFYVQWLNISSSIGKENVAAFGSIDLFGEDKGGRGYGGDRGFGRGDQRGGARGGGRGFDRDGPRSRDNRGGSFRDRDGGRDGNRERGPRDGGYYDGDGYRGRGGFNGGRNEASSSAALQ
uniref:RNA helicase n=1 Tax=Heligmosomoides polygyrus TaxID=6339 RepID=A0A8L8KKU8_HELPZ